MSDVWKCPMCGVSYYVPDYQLKHMKQCTVPELMGRLEEAEDHIKALNEEAREAVEAIRMVRALRARSDRENAL